MAQTFDRTAVLFLDFHVDICARGGKMLGQDEETLSRFEGIRRNAGTVLSAVRRKGGKAPFFAHVGQGFQSGYPELEGARVHKLSRYVMSVEANLRGTPGNAFVPELTPRSGEMVFWKQTISAFSGTGLPAWLNARGVSTVVLAGVVTHYAVLATALAAADLGYRVVVLEDCCTSGGVERHKATLEILGPLTDIMSSEALIEMMG